MRIGKIALGALALVAALLFLNNGGTGGYTEADLAQARETAYNEGYHSGYADGSAGNQEAIYQEGFEAGRTQGYDAGHSEGFAQGAQQQQDAALEAAGDSYQQGYDLGYNEGYAQKLRDQQAAMEQYIASLIPELPAVTPSSGVTAPSPSDGEATETTPIPDPEPVSQTVYVTKSGSKYHLGSCSHLSKSKIEKSLSEVKSSGYEPCKTCNPPQ